MLALDGLRLERQSFWIMEYLYNILTPRTRVELIVRSPGGPPRRVEVLSRVKEYLARVDLSDPRHQHILEDRDWRARRRYAHQFVQVGDSVHLWRMPAFVYGDDRNIRDLIKRARQGHTLILDLRGNSGGAVRTQLQLLSRLFDREVEVATIRRRGKTETLRAKPEKDAFLGPSVSPRSRILRRTRLSPSPRREA